MVSNMVIIGILVIGMLIVAIASIAILANYVKKHPIGKMEVFLKVPGCSFGAKASVGRTSDHLESATVTQVPIEEKTMTNSNT